MWNYKHKSTYLRSVKWNWAAIGVSFLRQIVLVPAFIYAAGSEGYAFWILLFNIATLITAFATGFLHYCNNLLALSFHKGNDVKALFSEVLGVIAITFLFQFAAGVIVSQPVFLSWIISFSRDYLEKNLAGQAFVLILLSRLFYQYASAFFARLFEQEMKVLKTFRLQFFIDFLDLLATACAIIITKDIFYTAVIVCVVNTAVLGITIAYVRKQISFFSSFSIRAIQFRILKNSAVLNTGFLIEKFYDSGLNIVVQAFFGPHATTLFSTSRNITNIFYRLTYSLMIPLFPDIQRQFVRERKSYLRAVTQKYWSISVWIIGFGIIAGLFLLPAFYEVWTNGKVSFNLGLIAYLFIGALCQNFIFMQSEFFKKTNFSGQLVAFSLIRVVTAVVVMYAAYRFNYIAGVGLGIAVAEVLAMLFALRLFTTIVVRLPRLAHYLKIVLLLAVLLIAFAVWQDLLILVVMLILLSILFFIDIKRMKKG